MFVGCPNSELMRQNELISPTFVRIHILNFLTIEFDRFLFK